MCIYVNFFFPALAFSVEELDYYKIKNKGKKRAAEEETSGPHTKTDWKKVKNEMKELKLQRKQKEQGGSERYNNGVRAKKIWEELRQSKCKKDRRKQLCQELWKLIQGNVGSFIYAHDTVRVVETLVAVGGDEYRTALFEEVKGEIVKLCTNRYSRFIVLKILNYGTRQQKDDVINAVKGKVVKLMKSKIACDIVELAYNDYANAKQRSMLVQEFYGPGFRLFPEETVHCLKDAFEQFPEKKQYILKDVQTALQPIIDKGVFTNTMIHTLLRDFLTYCSVGDRTAMIEALRESLAPIIHTRDGSRVCMLCLWHGTNKDRKAILKSFRTHYVKIATEEHGHMVLLAAFDCMDDTEFMKKVVLSELTEDLDVLVGSDHGIKVLRYLIAPRNLTFFQPAVVAVLAEGDGNAASKKDTDIRRRELQAAVSVPILTLLLANIEPWAVNKNWTMFIGAALKTLWSKVGENIFHKLAERICQPYIPGTEDHMLEIAHTNKMITYIIRCDKERQEKDRPTFSYTLLQKADEEAPGWISYNRGCFLLINMIETEIPEVVMKINRLITPVKDRLTQYEFPGAKILLKKL